MASRTLSLEEVSAMLDRSNQEDHTDDPMEVITAGSDDELGALDIGEGEFEDDDPYEEWDGK
jgi:hypothetical protein